MTCRKCALSLPLLFLLGVMLVSSGRISYSATATIIQVDPPMLFAESGEHFTINLDIMNAVDVYAWQVNVTWDPSVLQYVDATLPPDHFLEGRPGGTTGLQISELNESVLLGCLILGNYPGMLGTGTLVTVEFEVVGTGEGVLKLASMYTTLLDSNLVDTYPGPNLKLEDGYISSIDHPPSASFTYSPTSPSVNEIVTFDASASYDPDGYIVSYEWDFGDGTNISVAVPTATHAFTMQKTYTVTLIVTDNATATQMMMDTFNTTTVPHLWYELHSSNSTEVKLKGDHDIVVISPSASPTSVTVGEPVTISVTVENQGMETETFAVIAYYDGNTAATTTVADLAPDDSETLQLTWDTTDVAPGTYVIEVEASLEGDAHPDDNIKEDGTITVELPEAPFPLEYIVIIVAVVVVIGIGVFLFLRRRKTPAT